MLPKQTRDTRHHGEAERGSEISSHEQELPTRQSALSRLRAHLAVEVSTTHADIFMLTCCLISGLVDSTIYNAYGTFVSMQTGNTIFIGLGPSGPRSTTIPYGWAKSLTSIACFCTGCFCFSRISIYAGSLRRSTLGASFLLQSMFIFVAAAIIEAGVVDGALNYVSTDITWRDEIPIALLSFQAAGQIISSRALNLSDIPSVVITSMLCDISSDPNIIAPLGSNVNRNRKVLAFFAILVGAIIGGYIGKATGRVQVNLWIAGSLKMLITFAWVLWPEKSPEFS